MSIFMQLCVHDAHATTSIKEIFLQDFLVITKRIRQKNLKEMFPYYYMRGDVFSRLIFNDTMACPPARNDFV